MADMVCNLSGDSVQRLLDNQSDPGVLRPFYNRADGRSYYTKRVFNERSGEYDHRVFATNTASTLTYDGWKTFDNAMITVMRERLQAVADLRRRGLVYNLPNGMAHTVLQYQTQSDITAATVSMSPTRRSEVDRPETDTVTFPLPLVHKDFDYDARELLASRTTPMPLDTSTAMLAARKVAEELEKMLVGSVPPFKAAGTPVYGYITLPSRAVKTNMTVPTGSNGPTVVQDILALRQLLIDDNHRGPYVLYLNRQWSEVLDSDFSSAKGDLTLRQRLLAIRDIEEVTVLDHLPTTKWHTVLVEMDSANVRLIVGMEPTLVQWESMAGYMRHFKYLTLQVAQLRADTSGNSGIGHGTTSA